MSVAELPKRVIDADNAANAAIERALEQERADAAVEMDPAPVAPEPLESAVQPPPVEEPAPAAPEPIPIEAIVPAAPEPTAEDNLNHKISTQDGMLKAQGEKLREATEAAKVSSEENAALKKQLSDQAALATANKSAADIADMSDLDLAAYLDQDEEALETLGRPFLEGMARNLAKQQANAQALAVKETDARIAPLLNDQKAVAALHFQEKLDGICPNWAEIVVRPEWDDYILKGGRQYALDHSESTGDMDGAKDVFEGYLREHPEQVAAQSSIRVPIVSQLVPGKGPLNGPPQAPQMTQQQATQRMSEITKEMNDLTNRGLDALEITKKSDKLNEELNALGKLF